MIAFLETSQTTYVCPYNRENASVGLAHARPNNILGECSALWASGERGTVHGGRIRLLPPEINWAHRMLSQSSASSLLRWSCAHWLKRVASVLSDVSLSVATYIVGGVGL